VKHLAVVLSRKLDIIPCLNCLIADLDELDVLGLLLILMEWSNVLRVKARVFVVVIEKLALSRLFRILLTLKLVKGFAYQLRAGVNHVSVDPTVPPALESQVAHVVLVLSVGVI
jgi:hypothetical protein